MALLIEIVSQLLGLIFCQLRSTINEFSLKRLSFIILLHNSSHKQSNSRKQNCPRLDIKCSCSLIIKDSYSQIIIHTLTTTPVSTCYKILNTYCLQLQSTLYFSTLIFSITFSKIAITNMFGFSSTSQTYPQNPFRSAILLLSESFDEVHFHQQTT